MADGRHSLLDVAERSGVEFQDLAHAAMLAEKAGLIFKNDHGRSEDG
jgi:aminopeptidase-like protein